MGTKRQKLLYLEILRIIAIFFVIFNHTNVNGSLAYTLMPTGSLRWFIYIGFSILCKFAVPLFFMISGALLLNKEETLGAVFKKRVLRVITLIFVAYGFYFVLDLLNGYSLNIVEFLESIYRGSGMEHLWFLYAYLGFIISLPFLRSIARDLDWEKFLIIFVGVALLQFVLPILDFLIFRQTGALSGYLNNLWLFSQIVAFPLIGYYLEHHLTNKNKTRQKDIIILAFLAVSSLIISVLMTRYALFFTDYTELFFNAPAIFISTFLYVAIKRLFAGRYLPKWLNSSLLSMGSSVLGIYIIHPLIQVKTGSIAIFFINSRLGLLVSGLLWTLAVFLISYLIILMPKKIVLIGRLFKLRHGKI